MTKEVALAILPEIAERIPPDANGGGQPYTVSSLYFDDELHTLYHQTYDREPYRVKLRLRVYGNDSGDNSDSFFEIKSKLLGRSTKERLRLPLNENDALWQCSLNPSAEYLVSGETPPQLHTSKQGNKTSPKQYDVAAAKMRVGDTAIISTSFRGKPIILDDKYDTDAAVRQSLASLIYGRRLLPASVVSYERLAFAEPGAARLRVTFDSALRIRTDRLDLRLGTGGIPVMPDSCCVMEVKSCENIPTWITKLLYKYRLSNRSYSKYGQTPFGYAHPDTCFIGSPDAQSGYHNANSLKI